jgi:two-component system invasion response regulator UvrY
MNTAVSGAERRIKVVLVDDHALVRTGIRKILEAVSDIEVVGEASSGEEGVALCKSLSPHIVLMDKHMPGIGGVEATRRVLAQQSTRVICLTVDTVGPLPRRMLEMGAMGFLTKSCAPEEMISAVRKVYAGERYLGELVARRMADQALDGAEASPFDTLSMRELQVCIMLAGGQSSTQISSYLNLSPKTVSTYRARIFQKAECDNIVELVRKAIEFGLLEADVQISSD